MKFPKFTSVVKDIAVSQVACPRCKAGVGAYCRGSRMCSERVRLRRVTKALAFDTFACKVGA